MSLQSQLKRQVITMSAATPLSDVLHTMQRNNIGAVLLVDTHNHCVGIFTERDLLKKLDTIRSYNAWEKPISLVMSQPLKSLPLERMVEAAEFMIAQGIRHVPLTKGPDVVAMLSMRDLFESLLKTGRVSPQPAKITTDAAAKLPTALLGLDEKLSQTLKEFVPKGLEAQLLPFTPDEILLRPVERIEFHRVLIDLDHIPETQIEADLLSKLCLAQDLSIGLIYGTLKNTLALQTRLEKWQQGLVSLNRPPRLFPKPVRLMEIYAFLWGIS